MSAFTSPIKQESQGACACSSMEFPNQQGRTLPCCFAGKTQMFSQRSREFLVVWKCIFRVILEDHWPASWTEGGFWPELSARALVVRGFSFLWQRNKSTFTIICGFRKTSVPSRHAWEICNLTFLYLMIPVVSCGKLGHPAHYAKVSYFVPWIMEKIASKYFF